MKGSGLWREGEVSLPDSQSQTSTMNRFLHLGLLLSILVSSCDIHVASEVPAIPTGFEHVTCGSSIKLTHLASGYKLHSQGVSYGSGSGQQSVSAFPKADNPNSLWKVKAAYGNECTRGEPVPCGGIVRLQHGSSGGHLHSHLHRSPLSSQWEVSAFEGTNQDDNWKVTCRETKDKFWRRESSVTLLHKSTNRFLSASTRHVYRQPIHGQLEVAAGDSDGQNALWSAREGFYFATAPDAAVKEEEVYFNAQK